MICALTGVLTLFGCATSHAATTPPHTDVMFVFDTSGSMTGALEEAKAEINSVIASIDGSLPDAEFGLAEVRDYGGSSYDAEPGDEPWRLDVPVTSNVASVTQAISGLSAQGGGDGPEAYGRALWETDTNPSVGWRPEASHVIVLVADDVPHDNNLDEGIPQADWVEPEPWNTGEELAGDWNIPFSAWNTGDNLDFQSILQQLKNDGKPLEMVSYHDTSIDYLAYWEHWAEISGGQALEANSGELASKLTTLAEEGARRAPSNAFINLYNAPIPRAFRLQTPTPGMLQVPLGVELTPTLSISARFQPTDPQPTVNDTQGASFLTFGPLSFSVVDFKWQGASANGAAPPTGLLDGSKIGFEAQLGLLGAPTIDVGEDKPLEAAFSAPVASIEVKLPPVSLPTTGPVVPQAEISGGVTLNVKLYITQAVAYAGEKLVEGAVGSASDVLSGGLDTPLVVGALGALQAAEIALTTEKYVQLAVRAQKYWNLAVNQGIPLAELLGQLVTAEAPQLLSEVATYISDKLKKAVKWVSKGVAHVVSGIYEGGVWVVERGGHVIAGAAHVIDKGWHVVTGLVSAHKPLSPFATFEALPVAQLPVARLRSKRDLAFGPRTLTRAESRILAHTLVKYGFGRATVRPLLVADLTPKARRTVCFAAGRLSSTGIANVELTGPGYRGQALIRTRFGVGGGCAKMPAEMKPGRWTLAIVDYGPHAKRSGVLVAAYPFTVKRPSRKRHRAKHSVRGHRRA